MDFLAHWMDRTQLPARWFLGQLDLPRSTFQHWKRRGVHPEVLHPRPPPPHTATPEEAAAMLDFARRHPLEGYRSLAFMMLDADVAALSPSTVYRLLKAQGLMETWARKTSSKGTGFQQPSGPHRHWHVDITYINLGGTFFYLCLVLEGYSRAILHWKLAPSMTTEEVVLVIQQAKELHPGHTPRIISDNGPQFNARDFKTFIRLAGFTHVRTSPYYPQSNGKLERFNQTLKGSALRPSCPQTYAEAVRIVTEFLDYYNRVRLHSAVGYITPADMLAGHQAAIFASRRQKLADAKVRRLSSARSHHPNPQTQPTSPAAHSATESHVMSNLA
jgi:transposase InsO family protein